MIDKAIAIVAAFLFASTVTFALIAWYFHEDAKTTQRELDNQTEKVERQAVEINATQVASQAKGEIDITSPYHLQSLQLMFQRNMRKGQIERNATKPGDAINNALDDFWEVQNGSDGSTEQEKLL